MIGLLNGGLSGMTLGHSDIGGYTNFKNQAISYVRDQTLLFRWIEMNTFSDVILRSHPSNMPTSAAQIYDSEENILFFKKFATIHAKLADYKFKLMKDAQENGTPFTRPLMLHFPSNDTARKIHSEFMLGPCILVAPVFSRTDKTRTVFLPGPATWTHAWTGLTYTIDHDGLTMTQNAPLGQPAVYY
jgi:alpha-glucosidase